MKKSFSKLIFLHIPKSGGSTFHTILTKNYPRGSVFYFPFKPFMDTAIFERMPESEKKSIQVIKGHMIYGLHRLFEEDDVQYISFLRDPVDRIISHYFYVLKHPSHYLHDKVKNKLDLKSYVKSGLSVEMSNSQTKFIGLDNVPSLSQHCNETILEQAKRNIEKKFILVGLTEMFDESLLLLRHLLGWKKITYRRKNVNLQRKSREELDRDVIDTIIEHNAYDLALYEYAKERLRNQLEQLPGDFRKELSLFRSKNSLYSYFRSFLDT